MTTKQTIDSAYPGRVNEPESVQDIPRGVYMVYILICDDKPIVVGHGKHNRARIVFDDADHITPSHVKAIVVRAYCPFSGKPFERCFIRCDSKDDAKQVEKTLHGLIGGDSRSLPDHVQRQLFDGISPGSVVELVMRIALIRTSMA